MICLASDLWHVIKVLPISLSKQHSAFFDVEIVKTLLVLWDLELTCNLLGGFFSLPPDDFKGSTFVEPDSLDVFFS